MGTSRVVAGVFPAPAHGAGYVDVSPGPEASSLSPVGPLHVEPIGPADPRRAVEEEAVIAAGFALPMSWRAAAGRAGATDPATLLVVRDATGRCFGALGFATRELSLPPGHRVARLERLGSSLAPVAIEAALEELARVVRADSRILRVNAELFSRDASHRAQLAEGLRRAGFTPAAEPNCYESTLGVDLSRPIDDVFASLERSARRNIRGTAKHPVAVRTIDDPMLGDRMNVLVREALARTGGVAHDRDWSAVIRFSIANPALSRVVGFFRTDTDGPDALVAFAWGRAHGDHVEYADSGSVRPSDLRIALAYALVWDLIVWAKSIGASWFDLGGVTRGTLDDEGDPLGGISDFKRFFAGELLHVGEEWIFTPATARARLARAVHSGVVRLRSGAGAPIAGRTSDGLRRLTAYAQPAITSLFAPRGDMGSELGAFSSLHASGSDALHQAFRSASPTRSSTAADIVWAPAYHCGVEVQAALDAGFDVGYYRVNANLAVDVADLERRLANRPGTVLLIHYFGFEQPDAGAVARACADAGVPLVEDCAHALLTKLSQRPPGTRRIIAYSLQKFLGVFDGGALRIADPGVGARQLTLTGLRPNVRPYTVAVKGLVRALLPESVVGAARRLLSDGEVESPSSGASPHPSIHAGRRYGLGMSALSRTLAGAEDTREIAQRRRRNYELLASELAGRPGFVPVFPSLQPNTVPLVLPVRVSDRRRVVARLEAAGVIPYVFGEFPHPGLPRAEFPEASALSDAIVGLPVQQHIDPDDVRRIARIAAPILAEDARAGTPGS